MGKLSNPRDLPDVACVRPEIEKISFRAFVKHSKILDIGCNTGQVTATLASLSDRRVIGVDIDEELILAAYANHGCKHPNVYFDCANFLSVGLDVNGKIAEIGAQGSALSRGSNIPFCNYEWRADSFDMIVAFSVTKWIHFQYGDIGIKRFFANIMLKLRPGGIFVLEAQPWKSYKKKKDLTTDIAQTVANIKLHPGKFKEYCVGELGFQYMATINGETGEMHADKSESSDVPAYQVKPVAARNCGFDRPIMIFQKKCY